MTITKPMLAGRLEDIKDVRYPCLATPKLDGIRCLVVKGKAVTRNFKPLPNEHARRLISQLPEGFDGEVILKGKQFNETSSAIMSHEGEPDFTYAVFDWCINNDKPYSNRMKDLKNAAGSNIVEKILPVEIKNEKELLKWEERWLRDGYEGVMLRSPDGPYKMGRSTVREFFLVKFKRFTDSEAEVLSLEEQMENTNVATKDAFGHTERSGHKDGFVPKGTLGAFNVRDLKTKIEFSIGTGLNDVLRDEIWKNKKAYIGKIIKYKSQKCGEKDLPRFPVFLGFRHKNDM